LRAVNLGDDADTTGAVCGPLAGAYWGESGIPAEGLEGLARTDMIERAPARGGGLENAFSFGRRIALTGACPWGVILTRLGVLAGARAVESDFELFLKRLPGWPGALFVAPSRPCERSLRMWYNAAGPGEWPIQLVSGNRRLPFTKVL
jgi:hypothetical protein